MKLDRFAAIALTAATFACAGCGSSSATGTAPRTASATRYDAYAVQTATVPNAVGTTNLMSAELRGPAPRVGKAHLADVAPIDERDAFDTNADENAPKEARRSDGSHRSGSFGTPSK